MTQAICGLRLASSNDHDFYIITFFPFIASITMIKSESASGGQRRVGSILAGVLSVIEKENVEHVCSGARSVRQSFTQSCTNTQD